MEKKSIVKTVEKSINDYYDICSNCEQSSGNLENSCPQTDKCKLACALSIICELDIIHDIDKKFFKAFEILISELQGKIRGYEFKIKEIEFTNLPIEFYKNGQR